MNPLYVSVMVVFLLLYLGIGIWAGRRKVETSKDFTIAGFKLGPVVLVGTYLATFYSGASLIGGTGMVYRLGIAGNWWPLFYALATVINVFIAIRIRGKLLETPPEFMERRYGSRLLRIIASIGLVVGTLFGTLVQYKAMGIAWTLATGLSPEMGVIIGGILMATIITIGGLMSVAYSDVLKAAVFTIAIIWAGLWCFTTYDISSVLDKLSTLSTPPEVGAPPTPAGSLVSLIGTLGVYMLIFQAINWIFGIGIHPQYVQRMSAGKDMKTTLLQYLVGWPILCVIYILLMIASLIARAVIPTMPEGYTSDWALPYFLTTYAPPLVGAMFFAGIAAAAISTVDSQLELIAASIFSDIVEPLSGKKLTDEERLKWCRVTALVIALVMILVALRPSPLLLLIQTYGWGILAAIYAAPLIFGLYWKRGNREGALAASITGGLLAAVFQAMQFTGLLPPYMAPAAPAILASLIVYVIVTLMFPAPPEELTRDFFPEK